MDAVTEILPVQLEDGQRVLVEVRGIGGREQIADREVFPIEQLSKSITSVTRTVMGAIEVVAPDKATVEFGLGVTLKAGTLTALLCAGDTSANIKVTVEWHRNKMDR